MDDDPEKKINSEDVMGHFDDRRSSDNVSEPDSRRNSENSNGSERNSDVVNTSAQNVIKAEPTTAQESAIVKKRPATGNKDKEKTVTMSETVEESEIESTGGGGKLAELQQISALTVNFYLNISDINPGITKKTRMKKMITNMLKINTMMSQDEFNAVSKKLYNCSLKHIKDIHELHKRRLLAMEYLDDIIKRADSRYIDITQVVHLVWSVMSCIHHFQLRFRSGTYSVITWTRRKKAEQCMKTYVRLITKFHKKMHRTILNAIIIFYKEGRLWEIEFACTDLVCKLLYLYEDVEQAVEDILMRAELSSLNSESEAKQLIQVLYEVLEKIKWSHMSEAMLRRFLRMLRNSINPKPGQAYNYCPMRRGLNICLRNITRNLNNKDLLTLLIIIIKKITNQGMEDDALLEFGSIIEFAALRYKTEKYETSLPDDVVCNLLNMIRSTNSLHNLMGTRVFQNLMDRKNNRMKFNTPKIYFHNCKYDIAVSQYSVRDKNYFRKYREQLHLVILEAVSNHYKNKMNLESIFSLLAVMLVEIPCGYSASTIVCIAMAIQEFTLNKENMDMIASHHLHAVVLSIMSLVCYIHKAEVFYNYVNTIMETRAEFAPHLNPPIKANYDYAQHFILWNKPDLFFEDWEARFGLWKCFRSGGFVRKNRQIKPTVSK